MEYGKLKDGVLKRAGKCIWNGTMMYANPRKEILEELGYMEIVEVPMPEQEEGFYYSSEYTVVDGKIHQGWKKNAIEVVNEETQTL